VWPAEFNSTPWQQGEGPNDSQLRKISPPSWTHKRINAAVAVTGKLIDWISMFPGKPQTCHVTISLSDWQSLVPQHWHGHGHDHGHSHSHGQYPDIPQDPQYPDIIVYTITARWPWLLCHRIAWISNTVSIAVTVTIAWISNTARSQFNGSASERASRTIAWISNRRSQLQVNFK
jgi:hypothetical protein